MCFEFGSSYIYEFCLAGNVSLEDAHILGDEISNPNMRQSLGVDREDSWPQGPPGGNGVNI